MFKSFLRAAAGLMLGVLCAKSVIAETIFCTNAPTDRRKMEFTIVDGLGFFNFKGVPLPTDEVLKCEPQIDEIFACFYISVGEIIARADVYILDLKNGHLTRASAYHEYDEPYLDKVFVKRFEPVTCR